MDPIGKIISTPSEEYNFSSSDSEEDSPHLVSLEQEIPEIAAPTLATDKILTLNEFKIAQNSDSTLTAVVDWVQNHSPPTPEQLSGFLDTLKIYAEKFDSLEIREEILGIVDSEDPNSFALAVPQSLVDELLSQFHEGMGTAHEGAKKVLSRLNRSYFWPGMSRDVKLYVNSCPVCDKFRGHRKNPRNPLHPIRVGARGEILAIDLVGGKENLFNYSTRQQVLSCND